MATVTKFVVPDIPYIADRVLYDYFFLMNRLVNKLIVTVNALEQKVNDLHADNINKV